MITELCIQIINKNSVEESKKQTVFIIFTKQPKDKYSHITTNV